MSSLKKIKKKTLEEQVFGRDYNVIHITSFCELLGKESEKKWEKNIGPVRDLNPGPRAPEARIIPLDQLADTLSAILGHILETTTVILEILVSQ